MLHPFRRTSRVLALAGALTCVAAITPALASADCPTGVSLGDLQSLRLTANTAYKEAAHEPTDEVIVVLGNGGTVGADDDGNDKDSAAAAANAAVIEADTQYLAHRDCSQDGHWGLLETLFDLTDDRTTMILEELAALHAKADIAQDSLDLALTNSIEENLASNDPPIASYLLPFKHNNLDVGGYLDRPDTMISVRKIVDDTIKALQKSGLNVGAANASFNKANVLVGQKAYKAAYAEYRQAYAQAVGGKK